MRTRHWNGCESGRRRFPEALFAMAASGFGRSFGRGDWSAEWGGRGRNGHSRRRMFDTGELRLVLLKLIADEPRHGYDLIRAVEELTGGGYAPSPGVVYPTLNELQDTGHIEEVDAEGKRRAFGITETGKAELAEKAEEIDAIIERLSGIGERERKAGGAPVWRAMGNLAVVMRNRLLRDGVDDATLHEVAEIIDEAARRIERL
ncbi:MAG: PadR family transcriptional regulator [Sphingomonadaceae bacterium]|nr:PadR family transcriptional regulator [Sphingomonadaceae bacterium]